MNYHCESLINLKVWFLWAEALNPALRRSYDRHETNSDKECLSERCFRTYRIISVTMNLNDRPGKDTATKKDKRKTRITPSKPTKETTTNSNKFLQKQTSITRTKTKGRANKNMETAHQGRPLAGKPVLKIVGVERKDVDQLTKGGNCTSPTLQVNLVYNKALCDPRSLFY